MASTVDLILGMLVLLNGKMTLSSLALELIGFVHRTASLSRVVFSCEAKNLAASQFAISAPGDANNLRTCQRDRCKPGNRPRTNYRLR